jgi:alcohol dehydrogenase class IV
MNRFIFQGQPNRVVFGHGTRREVRQELEGIGCHTPLILCTPGQLAMAREVASSFEGSARIFSQAQMHTPVTVTEQAMQLIEEHTVDCLIAVGGGSAIGLAKAIALRTDLPQLALPTTYAGSEVTSVIGETHEGQKRTQKSPKVLPEIVIYDAELTLGLPTGFTFTSAMNAIAHAVEALYSINGNPVVSLLAEEGIKAFLNALPVLMTTPEDVDARAEAQYGAWLCGTCLGSVGMALHHKVCHVLGGTFGLPHAPTHAAMLPHALAYTAPAIPQAIGRLQHCLNHEEPWTALYQLNVTWASPTSLAQLGMPESGIQRAVELIERDAYQNPQPMNKEALTGMLLRAYTGAAPVIA